MRLISWNVNGIRAVQKKNALIPYIEKDNPDILCLQETKAQDGQIPEALLALNGYEKYFAFAEKKGYSGVAVFAKKKPRSVKTVLGVKEFDSEGRTLILDYDDFILYNVYFPNGKQRPERLQYKMGFYAAFLKQIEKERKKGRNIVVCGDVNTAHRPIDLANPKQNETVSGFLPEERAWMDEWFEKGYLDTLRVVAPETPNLYSWWTMLTNARERNVGWRIDYFIINEALRPKLDDAFILTDVYGSDHCPVGITLSL